MAPTYRAKKLHFLTLSNINNGRKPEEKTKPEEDQKKKNDTPPPGNTGRNIRPENLLRGSVFLYKYINIKKINFFIFFRYFSHFFTPEHIIKLHIINILKK